MTKKSKGSSHLHVRTIGFILKREHEEAERLAEDLTARIVSKNQDKAFSKARSKVPFKVLFEPDARKTYQRLKKVPHLRNYIELIEKNDLSKRCDLIIVLGGDGTFVGIARLMREHSVPIMGVNLGQLGFLTEFKRTEVHEALDEFFEKGIVQISERTMLKADLIRNGQVYKSWPVVNDLVVSKGAIARIVGIQIKMGDQVVNTLRADGLIVCTPTGSTAYSLAAGGPILEPSLEAMVLTPICPHALTQRSLVVPDQVPLTISLTHKPGRVLLTLDGQDAVRMQPEDEVRITRFEKHRLKIISSPTRGYFGLLREKLQFGLRG